MEYLDGLLYQDILFAVIKAFHTLAVLAFTDCSFAPCFNLVAVCAGFIRITSGIYGFVVSCQFEIDRSKASELLLSIDNVLCASSVVWLGQHGGYSESSIHKTLRFYAS